MLSVFVKPLLVLLWLCHTPSEVGALTNLAPKNDAAIPHMIRRDYSESVTNQPATSSVIDEHSIATTRTPATRQSKRNEVTSRHSYEPTHESTDEARMEGRRLFLGLVLAAGVASTTTLFPDEASATDERVSLSPSTSQELDSILPTTTVLSDAIPASAPAVAPSTVDFKAIFDKASKRALGGGKAGASAAVVQVLSLMWLRTSMNYQYRYGGNLVSSLKELWKEGGIPRLYQGLPFALIQGPLTRFGDTAANIGILALLDSTPETQALPLPVKTGLGSIAAGLWRIVLMPIDASKTAMQVEGATGLKNLLGLVAEEKSLGPLYLGSLAQASATAAGHFPWFLTYNFVDNAIPAVSSSEDLLLSLARSAFLGFSASCVSDICSNSLRVIKTTKQTARLGKQRDGVSSSVPAKDISYGDIVKMIIEEDGVAGLFGRGLQTRLLTNSIQGAVFSVLWKYFQLQS